MRLALKPSEVPNQELIFSTKSLSGDHESHEDDVVVTSQSLWVPQKIYEQERVIVFDSDGETGSKKLKISYSEYGKNLYRCFIKPTVGRICLYDIAMNYGMLIELLTNGANNNNYIKIFAQMTDPFTEDNIRYEISISRRLLNEMITFWFIGYYDIIIQKNVVGRSALIPMLKKRLPTIGDGLVLLTSGIKGAGYGLFTTMYHERGSLVTFYDGKILTYQEAKKHTKEETSHMRALFPMRYTIRGDQLEDGRIIKSERDGPLLIGHGGGAWINDPISDPNFNINVVFDWLDVNRDPFELNVDKKIIVLVAIKNITPFSEIFVSYGEDYWNKE